MTSASPQETTEDLTDYPDDVPYEDDSTDSDEGEIDILSSISSLRAWGRANLAGRVITFTGDKGGVGKTRNAIEASYCLDAVYCDLDWNKGNGSRALGWRDEEKMSNPMLTGFATGKFPRPLLGARHGRPDFIPCGEDFEHEQPPQEQITETVVKWASESDRCLVFDTHPGTGSAAYGVIAASHLVICVVKFENESIEALEGFADKMRGHDVALLLNEVRYPTDRHLKLLERIVETYELPVLTSIPYEKSLKERAFKTAAMSTKRVAIAKADWMKAMLQVSTEVGGLIA